MWGSFDEVWVENQDRSSRCARSRYEDSQSADESIAKVQRWSDRSEDALSKFGIVTRFLSSTHARLDGGAQAEAW